MKNKIKVYRAMYDLTQEDLAKKLGVSRQTIISIEKGKYDPSIKLAFKIAKYFNVKIEDIFIYEEENEKRV
ncbi:helix-turn-helix transcriptional regulator [Methanothermococcus sp.]|uniref:helix-turn-helix transcriptional regulator n=1 Tax=Methanothermococcus sp. TaxID=2614238 RepID=UPI0025E81C0C|nr:helix-turn-helix transcriptional regulator [Methanothermococcus sp.]